MIVSVSYYKKCIALLFMVIMYSEFVLAGYTSVLHYNNNTVTSNRQRYVAATGNRVKEKSDAYAVSIDSTYTPAFSATPDNRVVEEASANFGSGPTQPEMSAFQSVGSGNMVNLFSGDFSYNIPLMDVGGYPVNIFYQSGITMEQDASWVGLGWNINPGAITRNMRGLPDDFTGKQDSIWRSISLKENKTVGVTAGADVELKDVPMDLGFSLGVFHNTYKGWGMETGLNASVRVASGSKGKSTVGLDLNNNSQEGFSISPSFQYKLHGKNSDDISNSFGLSFPMNNRTGLKAIQLSYGMSKYKTDPKNSVSGGLGSSLISFSRPAYTPTMSYPMTSTQYTFTAKTGGQLWVIHPNVSLSGYVSTQKIEEADKRMYIPAYGYLNYQAAMSNPSVLLDFNREKDIAYSEKPVVSSIAVPAYTYDVFSITGEGTGGMFRAYRGDIGYVYDNFLKSKDNSLRASIDLGGGALAHSGADLNLNRAYTQTGPWQDANAMRTNVAFQSSDKNFEAAYFRNPGEKSINSREFYKAIGDDDLVTVKLAKSGSYLSATNILNRYNKSGVLAEEIKLPASRAVKPVRDKRAQVISYLTAQEASIAGVNKYIENHILNTYGLNNCKDSINDLNYGAGEGLMGYYYNDKTFSNLFATLNDETINFSNYSYIYDPMGPDYRNFDKVIGQSRQKFSTRWLGRIKAPATGTFKFMIVSDDQSGLYVNDSLLIAGTKPGGVYTSVPLNMVEGQFYNIKVDYIQDASSIVMHLGWSYNGGDYKTVPKECLYHVAEKLQDTVSNSLVIEKRINSFRKPTHISQINVLNPDGRRYVYGIPVYNLYQRDATFSVNAAGGNLKDGLVKYEHGVDDTTTNNQGKEGYYNAEDMPSYAHSFMLTNILSPDYIDLTGDGVSDDDPGDAIKFNYSRVAGLDKPFEWRAPAVADSASYNEGFRSYSRDDKGSYSYGRKELWYLNSIVSKNMIATFKVSDREDLLSVNQRGVKDRNRHLAKKLDEINLYSKADFLKNGSNATPVKTVHFEYSYELCKGANRLKDTTNGYSGKLTLKKIWFSYNGNNKGKQNPYNFYYHSNNPGYNLKSFDRWGNFKDPSQNVGATAGNLVTNQEYPYALQDSTLAGYNAAAWTLDSIGLPSGGSIKVQYESDDYAFVQDKRAMQMYRVVGLSRYQPTQLPLTEVSLYSNKGEHTYVTVAVNDPVSSNQQVFKKYLEGLDMIYFRMRIKMPKDDWGEGFENIPCYAYVDKDGGYGFVDANHIWFKIKHTQIDTFGITNASPLFKAAMNYLRLNLPSKAYPGSEVMDDFGPVDAIKGIFGLIANIVDMVRGFESKVKSNNWTNVVDTARSLVRLNTPFYKKYGGGLRVKKVLIYDNWKKMSKGNAESVYGQEYEYTTLKQIDGTDRLISSGVAAYEPFIGGEENPFHMPVQYGEPVSVMAPTTVGYAEEPLGETFFPSASVGYSKVRVKSIHTKNVKSAPGYEETEFYTAYDFPTVAERTVLGDNKERYFPSILNFLKIESSHLLALSQGFKIELNDMHGKVKRESSYSSNNSLISQTSNYYKTEHTGKEKEKLANTVWTIGPDGKIDTASVIGKDIEIMMDMREELSETAAKNFNVDGDMFQAGVWPVILLGTLNMFQHDRTVLKSIATTKIVQRYGILDSIVHVEKGSRITTQNILYDSETGDPVLNRTENEFKDSIYTFSYPAHWSYEGMSGAYQNIDLSLKNVFIKSGKIISGITEPDSVYFASGDEILIGSRQKTDLANTTSCKDTLAWYPSYGQMWAVNVNELKGGPKDFYFMWRDGSPVTANDATLKVIRSGRRNIAAQLGQVASLHSPVVKAGSGYQLQFDVNTGIINASAVEYKQDWKVEDKMKSKLQCLLQ
ncbi:PA14 domain-containing protein [Filimonas lacunae]|nr:PA14 domain-containing protein [Filimonas lacunae]